MQKPIFPLFRGVLSYVLTAAVLFVGLFIIFAWPAISVEVKYSVGGFAAQPIPVPAPQSHDSRISIPKIGVSAPIFWDIPAARSDDFLDKGVVELAESVKPGNNGNTALFGHSSDYLWKRDPYATVFTLLPKLKNGDQITVLDDGTPYTYQVTNSFIIKPTQVDVIDTTTSTRLTLVTCYPIGTTLLRYVVQAEPVAAQ